MKMVLRVLSKSINGLDGFQTELLWARKICCEHTIATLAALIRIYSASRICSKERISTKDIKRPQDQIGGEFKELSSKQLKMGPKILRNLCKLTF